MTNRKNYNSIAFLTTLSVYLGLVLVGGTPLVLAQNSSVSFEERLNQDKDLRRVVEECGKIKPRIQRKSYGENVGLSYTIEDFITALIDLSAHSICLAPNGFAFDSEISYPFSPKLLASIPQKQKPTSTGTWTSDVLTSHIETLGNSLPHTKNRGDAFFTLDFELDKTNLSCIAKFKQNSKEQTQQTALLYENSLKSWQTANRNTPEAAIYENTKITYENDQIFIVTRLPRGSLDALLAKDAQ
ncbi:MAG: hypothetical protein H0W58_12780 [Acidobacteria bacterium]|jgi:hypothetical protein|nr:hypothetical protein [Acidobacteriota bacterium]